MTGASAGASGPVGAWTDLPAPSVDLVDLLDAPRLGPADTSAAAVAQDRRYGQAVPEEELASRISAATRSGPLPDPDAAAAAAHAVARLATPPGALGRLGAVASALAGISGTSPPPLPRQPALIVAAGDHGIHAGAVSPWPQTVSATVARLIAEGRAGTSALATGAGARTVVVDVGLATDVLPHPRLVDARVVAGTRDATIGDAWSRDAAVRAVLVGARVADAVVAAGADLLAVGDVGIGNTTTSAALIGALTGADAGLVTGRGSGIDDATLARKQAVVTRLLHRAAGRHPLGLLTAIGGAEHAALAGVLLTAAARRIPVVLDGVVTAAAALVAARLAAPIRGVLLAGHLSPEPGAGVALQALGLDPLLDLGLRLGEGSGALLAVPVVTSAARLLHEVATLDEALA